MLRRIRRARFLVAIMDCVLLHTVLGMPQQTMIPQEVRLRSCTVGIGLRIIITRHRQDITCCSLEVTHEV